MPGVGLAGKAAIKALPAPLPGVGGHNSHNRHWSNQRSNQSSSEASDALPLAAGPTVLRSELACLKLPIHAACGSCSL